MRVWSIVCFLKTARKALFFLLKKIFLITNKICSMVQSIIDFLIGIQTVKSGSRNWHCTFRRICAEANARESACFSLARTCLDFRAKRKSWKYLFDNSQRPPSKRKSLCPGTLSEIVGKRFVRRTIGKLNVRVSSIPRKSMLWITENKVIGNTIQIYLPWKGSCQEKNLKLKGKKYYNLLGLIITHFMSSFA